MSYITYPIYQPYTPKPAWNRYAVAAFVLTLTGTVVLAVIIGLVILIQVLAYLSGYSTSSGTDPYSTYDTAHIVTTSSLNAVNTDYEGSYVIGAIVGFTIIAMPIIAVILGIIFGHIALNPIRRDLRGRGLAIAALIIGYTALGLETINIIAGFLLR